MESEDLVWLCVALVGFVLVFTSICVVVDGHLVPGTFFSRNRRL
jgi:hypothetical protein